MNETNPMTILYKHFGEEKSDNQEMYSITNVFYELGAKDYKANVEEEIGK